MRKKKIFTIGHSNRTLEEFLKLLQENEITLLVDIRSFPGSKHVPQFNKENLEISLPEHAIHYEHCKDLGGRRKVLKNSKNLGWEHPSFRGYADYMQTKDFEKALEGLIERAKKNTTAIMCAEAVPWRCHRRLVSDALLVRGFEVKEIVSLAEPKDHVLTSFAKVVGRKIIYPLSKEARTSPPAPASQNDTGTKG